MKTLNIFFILVSSFILTGCSTNTTKYDYDAVQAISVKVTVPDLGWIINIDEVYKVEGELWVISVLHRPPGMFGQQITTKSDTVKVPCSSLPVKHFVLGKTWGWQNKEPYVFLNNRDEIAEKLESGKLVFKNGVDQ